MHRVMVSGLSGSANGLETGMLKDDVKDFWEAASCGEELYLADVSKEGFEKQLEHRYTLEPYIIDFAEFDTARGQKVLEIGVGLGADHQRFAEAGAELYGIDLTQRAIEFVKKRLELYGLQSNIKTGDAEALDFDDDTFDLVYSWGVIHHSPDTDKAAEEILRVLRPGGRFKVMIYHRFSFVGYMLWLKYALFRLKPWKSLDEIYSAYLESPGTKAYSVSEGKKLFRNASRVRCKTVLTHGDLLSSNAGQRHRGLHLRIARAIWPRSIIKSFFPEHGLFMLLEGEK